MDGSWIKELNYSINGWFGLWDHAKMRCLLCKHEHQLVYARAAEVEGALLHRWPRSTIHHLTVWLKAIWHLAMLFLVVFSGTPTGGHRLYRYIVMFISRRKMAQLIVEKQPSKPTWPILVEWSFHRCRLLPWLAGRDRIAVRVPQVDHQFAL